MRSSVSRGFAAFFLSAAFAASSISAQTEKFSPDLRQPQTEATTRSGRGAVSVDVLRHPVSAKVRQRLLRAMDELESADYETAIGELLETLKKYPESAAYVHSLLGVAYVKTDRIEAAVSSLEQAILLLPHEPMTHYNFGLALICAGDYRRAEQEVQRALELDPKNPVMRARLNELIGHNRSGN